MVSIRKAELKNIINLLKFDPLKTFTNVCFMEAVLFASWKLKPLLRLWLHTNLKNLVILGVLYRADL